MQGARSFMLFLKASLKQPGWSSFSICKARRNLRPQNSVSCPVQLEVACTEAALQEGQQQMVCYVTALCAPPTEPEPRQGCRAGEMRDSKQNCAPRTSHAIKKTSHKAGDTSLPQLKKPEQPSAEELGIREEIHWFRLFTHAQKAKHLFWSPLKRFQPLERPVHLKGLSHKVGHSWGKAAFPPRESLGAWTVLSVGRRNILLLEREGIVLDS